MILFVPFALPVCTIKQTLGSASILKITNKSSRKPTNST